MLAFFYDAQTVDKTPFEHHRKTNLRFDMGRQGVPFFVALMEKKDLTLDAIVLTAQLNIVVKVSMMLTYSRRNSALCSAQTVCCYEISAMRPASNTSSPIHTWQTSVWWRYSLFQFGQGVTADSHHTITLDVSGKTVWKVGYYTIHISEFNFLQRLVKKNNTDVQ